jgi:hypothetical protein
MKIKWISEKMGVILFNENVYICFILCKKQRCSIENVEVQVKKIRLFFGTMFMM